MRVLNKIKYPTDCLWDFTEEKEIQLSDAKDLVEKLTEPLQQKYSVQIKDVYIKIFFRSESNHIIEFNHMARDTYDIYFVDPIRDIVYKKRGLRKNLNSFLDLFYKEDWDRIRSVLDEDKQPRRDYLDWNGYSVNEYKFKWYRYSHLFSLVALVSLFLIINSVAYFSPYSNLISSYLAILVAFSPFILLYINHLTYSIDLIVKTGIGCNYIEVNRGLKNEMILKSTILTVDEVGDGRWRGSRYRVLNAYEYYLLTLKDGRQIAFSNLLFPLGGLSIQLDKEINQKFRFLPFIGNKLKF